MKKLIFMVMFIIVMLFTSLAMAIDSFKFKVDSMVDFTVIVTVYDRDFNEIEYFEKDFDWDIVTIISPTVYDAYMYQVEVFITYEEDYNYDNFIYIRYGNMGVYSDEDCGYGYINIELFTE